MTGFTRMEVKATKNLRHLTLIAAGCKYLTECIQANSANQAHIERADYDRLGQYLDDLESNIESLNVSGSALTNEKRGSRPYVDAPTTSDYFYDFDEPQDVPDMENMFWRELCFRLRNAVNEISVSQSRFNANEWHQNDPPRWKGYLDSIRHDMQNFVGNVEPVDRPVTMPTEQHIYDQVNSGYNAKTEAQVKVSD